MTTTVMNVMLMGDDHVDDVADLFCSFAWATFVVRFAAARCGAQPTTSESTMGALAVPGAGMAVSAGVPAVGAAGGLVPAGARIPSESGANGP